MSSMVKLGMMHVERCKAGFEDAAFIQDKVQSDFHALDALLEKFCRGNIK